MYCDKNAKSCINLNKIYKKKNIIKRGKDYYSYTFLDR